MLVAVKEQRYSTSWNKKHRVRLSEEVAAEKAGYEPLLNMLVNLTIRLYFSIE